MNDPNHLYEADKHRISDEAKVRTALEDPDFANREFEKWQASRERGFEIEKRDYFVNAWAKVAWLAEGRMLAMGRELAKAQQRIGRQRKANRQAIERIKHLEEENARLLQDGINGFLDSGFGSDMNEALNRLLRKAKKRAQQLEALLREVRPHIGDECQRIWPDDPEFEDMLVRLDAVLSSAKAREGEDVGNRPN